MQLLVIKIDSLDANPKYALLGKRQTETQFTSSDWEKIRSLTRGRRVLLLVPDNEVVLTSVKIPSKNKKQLMQAIPYALEDTLAEDIEDLHFAVHDNQDLGTQVAVINRQKLDSFLVLLRKNGIAVHFALPQLLVLPLEKGAWSIQQEQLNSESDKTVSVRLNDFYGFTCDESLLTLFLEQLDTTPPEFIFTNISKEDLPEELQEYPLKAIDGNNIQYKSVASALPLNLITGFVSKKRESNVNWKIWKPTLVLGSLVAAAWLGIFGWQNQQLTNESKHLTQTINNIFNTTFPNKNHKGNAVARMQSELTLLKRNSGKTIDSPLPLISQISPLLKQFKDVSLQEVRYKENELTFVMHSPNLARLESFKKDAAQKMKLKVDLKSSTTTANKVEAILTIKELPESNTSTNKQNDKGSTS
jgi:type II secretion system protein L